MFFTSNERRNRLLGYIATTMTCSLFSLVYELHSHQVYSRYMVCLAVIPLLLGVLPQTLLVLRPQLAAGGPWQHTIHNFAISSLTTGSALSGVVEIYGTRSPFIFVYFIIGAILLLTSVLLWFIQNTKPMALSKN